MKIHDGIVGFPRNNNAVVTSGTFDGVHIGHQKILNTLKEIADNSGGETVLITYWPHPRLVLDPKNDQIKLLTLFEEKATLLEHYGLDHLVKIPFTKEFSNLSSTEFIQKVLVEGLGTQTLVIGYDHKFGRNREGSFQSLQRDGAEYGFDIREIPRQDIENAGVSSSRIRKTLAGGDIHISNQLLGWEYSIHGKVIHGNKLGRKLGFPTANLEIESSLKLIPAGGSYAVKIIYADHEYRGMLNIGMRPTVDGTKQAIEVHIFDFDTEIYDEVLEVKFIRLIRYEKKFENVEALSKQLAIDKEVALKYLS